MKVKFVLLVVLVALAVNALIVLAQTTHVISYKCPTCGRVEQYAEQSYHTHYCTGSTESPHPKQVMRKIGESDVK